jgi:hypothetical protein
MAFLISKGSLGTGISKLDFKLKNEYILTFFKGGPSEYKPNPKRKWGGFLSSKTNESFNLFEFLKSNHIDFSGFEFSDKYKNVFELEEENMDKVIEFIDELSLRL